MKRRLSEAFEEDDISKIRIHPLLQTPQAEATPIVQAQEWRNGSIKNVNPYYQSEEYFEDKGRRKVLIGVNVAGEQRSRGDAFRERLRREREAEEREKDLERKGHVPNLRLGEEKYAESIIEPNYVEWWDRDYFDRRGNLLDLGNIELITSYVQHPVIIGGVSKGENIEEKVYLTKKEMKKLRRGKRKLAIEEKRDMIKLGLLKNEGDKVSLKNLPNVLLNEGVANPTEVEMRVREQVAKRREQHEAMNEERKLTKEQRNEKRLRGIERDVVKNGVYCLVAIIRGEITGKLRYKVGKNAAELELNGICASVADRSLVVVEGASKSVEKYENLFERRIDWSANGSRLNILWKGKIASSKFQKWSMYAFDGDVEIKEFLRGFGIENWWVGYD